MQVCFNHSRAENNDKMIAWLSSRKFIFDNTRRYICEESDDMISEYADTRDCGLLDIDQSDAPI